VAGKWLLVVVVVVVVTQVQCLLWAKETREEGISVILSESFFINRVTGCYGNAISGPIIMMMR